MSKARPPAPPTGPKPTRPRARRAGLLVQELADETLVYDLERDRAHCLNRSAALVWQHCDGQTTVSDLARLLQRETDLPADEAIVCMALNRLAKAHLLGERVTLPEAIGGCSRREVLRRLGLAGGLAFLLPAVTSIVAPDVAQAASDITQQACFQDPVANAGKCCADGFFGRRLCVNIGFGFGLCTGSTC